MSNPRYRWWGFVRRMVRDYRGLKTAYDDLHRQTVTASASGLPGSGGVGRPTEQAALRQLPNKDDQAAYDAVTQAVELTRLKTSGEEKVQLIRLMYWTDNPRNLTAAADKLHISPRTARRWHADFLRTVAVCYGFSLNVGLPEPTNRDMLVP